MASFFDFLKTAHKEYKAKQAEEKLKSRLVKNTMDYAFMSKCIGSVTDNPNARIEITLTDGTRLVIRADEKKTHVKKDWERIYEE